VSENLLDHRFLFFLNKRDYSHDPPAHFDQAQCAASYTAFIKAAHGSTGSSQGSFYICADMAFRVPVNQALMVPGAFK